MAITDTTTKRPIARRKKISVNLRPDVERILDEISESKGLKQTEVIQDALKLLSFVLSEGDNGRRIFSVDADGENARELVT